MISKHLIVVRQLPLIPENWDYEKSVNDMIPKIEKWKQETYEIACELYIAREYLSKEGRPKKLGQGDPVLTWAKYCKDIGIPKRTGNRWIVMIFGQVRPPHLPLPKIEAQVLYADPPWEYRNPGFDQSAEQHYPTMATDAICNYTDPKGKKIRNILQPRSVLFLWVTQPMLPDGLKVLRAWGFDYKVNMVWKKDKAPGIGFWVKSIHELLLIGSKGAELHPAVLKDSVFEADVRGHSEKPEIVYDWLEEMYTGPFIELFATKPARNEKWEVWGYEV